MSATQTSRRPTRQLQRGSGVQARREANHDVISTVLRDLGRMPSETAKRIGTDLGELTAVAQDVPALNEHMYALWTALVHERRKGDLGPLLPLVERWARRTPGLSSVQREVVVAAVIRAERRRMRKLKEQRRIAEERELEDALYAASDWY